MASSQETPADIIPENQESEQPESEESSEAFNCEGLDHCYDTEDNLDRHLTDGEWSQCDHIVCPHRYSGSTNFELAEWALYPASWQESLEFSTWFLSRGLLPEPHNLTALPVDTGLNSWVPSVAASALQSQVHTCYATARANTPTCTLHVLLTKASVQIYRVEDSLGPRVPRRNTVLR